MDPGPQPELDWKDGRIPVARAFDDPYFSLAGGLEECRHVFLAGNDLPQRLCDGFHIAELGFGTGLNLLTLALEWARTGRPGCLRFTSFEAFPMAAADMARALAAFPAAAAIAAPLLAARAQGATEIALPGVDLRLILGDARETLGQWDGVADAWFLDGFSPAKNPQMWGEALMAEVARHTAPGGSFATYTAAGHVRRALAATGFQVERAPGFAGKRHMTKGRLVGAPGQAPVIAGPSLQASASSS
ncbi:tRNA (5-methylaminomethyl-2-thiouridine)(34)-methyltransferase MnmD [Rhodobacter sp. Har01]|uniref:tRNA (5-methylaminomethyl-2-thiouridine)(34)-methyltransferase MnmD n=1 Tax=Rhodobacter sp. Har01 TaxID=2883999 RepID=UPI001D0828CA|nr:tRNA (5-methylaminomethyl-2-thiouridine)(34)-methyltransferase MnmD [Rhodobacter sp. Har01]MCB6179794.1 tRNA (5-methylaminomethyl-2-thiouridine)(34)-methyltransferase MnmD [Rhodobacter sp. Har01]